MTQLPNEYASLIMGSQLLLLHEVSSPEINCLAADYAKENGNY